MRCIDRVAIATIGESHVLQNKNAPGDTNEFELLVVPVINLVDAYFSRVVSYALSPTAWSACQCRVREISAAFESPKVLR